MRILRRYVMTEILGSVAFVFAALLMLFAFLDLVREMKDLGQGAYGLGLMLLYVLLLVPGHVYELFPIAVLIGTLFALAQLVGSSEYAVMRSAGISVSRFAFVLIRVGVVAALVNFGFGEFIAPASEEAAQKLRLRATRGVVAQDFRSGLWVKEESSFVNVTQPLPDNTLLGVKIYEFDDARNLKAIVYAKRGEYVAENRWKLTEVIETRFAPDAARVSELAEREWQSVLTPDILNVLLVIPEQRSARDLYEYIQHLRESRQQSHRFEIALWTKFSYPAAVIVMMLLALPFAQFQRRAGGVGPRIFAGIMLGVAFFLVNRMVGYLGAINEWPAPLAAWAPTALFLTAALTMLWWLERR